MLCEYGCNREAVFQLKNGKMCCSQFPNSCLEMKRKNGESKKGLIIQSPRITETKGCQYCQKEVLITGIKQHERNCYLNPINKKECPVCGKAIKAYRTNVTCSHSCSNRYFDSKRSLYMSKKPDDDCKYTTICFRYHEHKCVVCGEDRVVAVHHLNECKEDNSSTNLIPLCPTHHVYWHSRYRNLIEEQVMNYIKEFEENHNANRD